MALDDDRKRELERLQRELVADLSHELKTPIATLRVAAETLLKQGTGSWKRGVRFLKIISLQTERLSKLVDNLLHFTALSEEGGPLRRERFSLSGLVRECVRDRRLQLKEKSLTLRVRLEPGVQGRGDRDGLRRAIENLIDNAIQYNRAGGRVEVKLRRVGGDARLTVQDTGVGIAQSELSRLFERFHRTRRAKRLNPSGTGLGLAIIKQVVEAHDGRVSVRSRPGFGSIFQLSLPRDRSSLR